MERIFIQSIGKIRKLKEKIEKSLNVRITFTKSDIEIESPEDDAYAEYIARKIIDALQYGFTLESALNLKNEDCMIEKINVKDYSRPSRWRAIVSRLIGEKGRTKEIISEMTGCEVAIHDYTVAIIGDTADVSIATHAIQSLINGSPHATVYAYLERNRKFRKYSEEDLGLKKAFRKVRL